MAVHNDPELDGKYLGTISKDFVQIAENLKEASYQIRKRGFSDHPIFVVSKTDQPIGSTLIEKEELSLDWSYNASYLDEFVQRKIIAEEKMEAFISTYKDPDEFCCLFVIDNVFTKFMYIPYPID